MGQHAPLGPAAGPGGVDDAGQVRAVAGDKLWRGVLPAVLPALSPGKIRLGGGFGDQNGFGPEVFRLDFLGQGPPERVLDDQHLGLGVSQQGEMVRRPQLVVQGHQHAAAVEDRVGADEPLGLIGHQDAGSVAGYEPGGLQGGGNGPGGLGEVSVGQATVLPVAVGFDQRQVIRPLGGGGTQGFAQRTVRGQVGAGNLHQSLESTRSARVRKSVTPWSS